MWAKIKLFFSKWFSQFRPGLQGFLMDELDAVKQIMFSIWITSNRPRTLAEWKDRAFAELRARYVDKSDTQLQIILHLAYDALKAAKKIG